MQNVKTNVLGILKLIGVIAFIAFKWGHGQTLNDAEQAVVMVAFGNVLGDFFSADAKKNLPPDQPK